MPGLSRSALSRRRRFVARCLATQATVVSKSEVDIRIDPRLFPAPTVTTRNDTDANDQGAPMPDRRAFKRPALMGRSPVTVFNEIVHGDRPLTWVFVGERWAPEKEASMDWPLVPELLHDHLRESMLRLSETVLDNTSVQCPLSQLEDELSPRVLKCSPDIVIINIGREEWRDGADQLAKLEWQLARIVTRLLQEGIVPILATPPFDGPDHDEDDVDSLLVCEAIRGAAAEFDVPLVDHRTHWEWAAEEIGGTDHWFVQGTDTPGAQAQEQFARRMIEDLWLFGAEQAQRS